MKIKNAMKNEYWNMRLLMHWFVETQLKKKYLSLNVLNFRIKCIWYLCHLTNDIYQQPMSLYWSYLMIMWIAEMQKYFKLKKDLQPKKVLFFSVFRIQKISKYSFSYSIDGYHIFKTVTFITKHMVYSSIYICTVYCMSFQLLNVPI